MFLREDIGTKSRVVTVAKKKGTYVKIFKVIESTGVALISWRGKC